MGRIEQLIQSLFSQYFLLTTLLTSIAGPLIFLLLNLSIVTCFCDCSVKQKVNYVKTTSAKEMI